MGLRTRAGGLAVVAVVGLSGCVGPATPLGAIDDLAPRAEGEAPAADPSRPDPQRPPVRPGIYFSPAFQQAHGPYDWRVAVLDPRAPAGPDPARIRVTYNGQDVTRSSNAQFRVERWLERRSGSTALVLTMPRLRLDPLREHRIRVTYQPARGPPWEAEYAFPRVDDFEAQEPVRTTAPFDPPPGVLEAIDAACRAYRVNPALLAALIAQESSFDPYAVSRAGALGLTQITHPTEPEIARAFPAWPRYPGIAGLSRRALRRMVPGAINGRTEWRLDPVKSVWGGAYYLAHLRDRVESPANARFVDRAGPPRDDVRAALVLAAYNSGLNRVLYYAKRFGPGWLDQRRAREAKRYVRKILSYYGAFRSAPGGTIPPLGGET